MAAEDGQVMQQVDPKALAWLGSLYLHLPIVIVFIRSLSQSLDRAETD